MKTIESSANSEVTIKGSRFLSFLVPYADFENTLCALRKNHLKAVHFVVAYRALNEKGQVCERSSDDGEPKGSSGIPVLNVLRGADLIDCGCVVVRYFGGILLGVGGLVRAYTKATQEALKQAESKDLIIPYEICENIILECDYANLKRLKHAIDVHKIKILKQEFLAQKVRLEAQGSHTNLENLKSSLKFSIVILQD